VPQAIASIITSPNGSGQSIREKQGRSIRNRSAECSRHQFAAAAAPLHIGLVNVGSWLQGAAAVARDVPD
jgi:hypothetical protein